jgi:hypothetical protein
MRMSVIVGRVLNEVLVVRMRGVERACAGVRHLFDLTAYVESTPGYAALRPCSTRLSLSPIIPAPAATRPSTFVVTQVRQALQQAVAIGACSPYLPAA